MASITSTFAKLLKKGHRFEWGGKQQKAFQKLQQIMMNLPTIQAPTRKKPLLLYLASSPSAIRELIAQKDGGGIKQLVYYVSHALKDVETCYPQVERVCSAIVYTSQSPCHYFLPYELHLMTKAHAIKVLLWQPIFSGRISQWLL